MRYRYEYQKYEYQKMGAGKLKSLFTENFRRIRKVAFVFNNVLLDRFNAYVSVALFCLASSLGSLSFAQTTQPATPYTWPCQINGREAGCQMATVEESIYVSPPGQNPWIKGSGASLQAQRKALEAVAEGLAFDAIVASGATRMWWWCQTLGWGTPIPPTEINHSEPLISGYLWENFKKIFLNARLAPDMNGCPPDGASIWNVNPVVSRYQRVDRCPLYWSYKTDGTCNTICSIGSTWSSPEQKCVVTRTVVRASAPPIVCSASEPAPNPKEGNPIYPLTGTKRETVSLGINIGGVDLTLVYDSTNQLKINEANGGYPPPVGVQSDQDRSPTKVMLSVVGPQWSSSLHRGILSDSPSKNLLAARGDGRTLSFLQDRYGRYISDADAKDKAVYNTAGFQYWDSASNSIEVYGLRSVVLGEAEKLSAIHQAQGEKIIFTYSDTSTPASIAPAPRYLIKAQESSGRSVSFVYNAKGLMTRVTDDAGKAVNLAYNAGDNLSLITWPDGKTRRFLYESTSQPWALTGIVDELGVRYATFGYGPLGNATFTEHAGGVQRFSVSYTTAPQIQLSEVYNSTEDVLYRYYTMVQPQGVTLTTPNGSSVAMSSASLNGKNFLTSQTQPAGSGCAASTSQMGYDANGNGNVAFQDGFDGKRVCYAHDLTRNLQSARVEGLATGTACAPVIAVNAALPANSRKVSTQWHPDWRLENRIAEPGKITTLIYNGQPDPTAGNAIASCAPASALLPDGKPIAVLCKKVEQATTDANGAAGFSAASQPGVAARVWKWTYNNFGQVLTEDGPRTDVSDVTTYTYHAATAFTGTDPYAVGVTLGDLKSITNAAGTTQYTKYNKHGQLLESIDPNGVVSSYSYDLRQRMLSSTVGGQQTTYAYDAAGQLKKVARPDTSWTGYDYDPAHRLVAVYDNLGNRVDYTLDNAGNRTAENIKDPGGVLKRQLARSIDPLGRVQQTTGRE